MATQNAIDTNKPIEVAVGGTGLATLTDHSPLIGAGTAALSDMTVGATGLLLVGSTTADPLFEDASDGDFTFTRSDAGDRFVKIENLDNATDTSDAYLSIVSGGSSGGDPYIRYNITSVTNRMVGLDNSDSDTFKISHHDTDIGTDNRLAITVDGYVTKIVQSAFGAKAADQENVTGDGTVYVITFSDAEYFDQNSDFDGTSTFTAPVTGRYQFNAVITYGGIGAHTTMQVRVQTSNRNYILGVATPAGIKDALNQLSRSANAIVDMDAADICQIGAWMIPTNKTVDIIGSGTFFNGWLVC